MCEWLGYDVELEKEQILVSNEMFEIEGPIGRNHWQESLANMYASTYS